MMRTGIGLRAPHVDGILAEKPAVGFLEAHAENYFSIGGAPFEQLMACRALYPVSLHGVGLSLGSADGLDANHLQKLKNLVGAVDPLLVSEHIAWSAAGGKAVPDLLPLPYTQESLGIICRNIAHVQETLGRAILVENPSSYIAFEQSEMSEPEFISEIIKTTGCGLLLDVNNIYVGAHNLGFDAEDYIGALPKKAIGEVHLAGYQDNGDVYIDAHNHPVYEPVWALYRAALKRFGAAPALIEWDRDLPSLQKLVAEAKKADDIRAEELRHARVA